MHGYSMGRREADRILSGLLLSMALAARHVDTVSAVLPFVGSAEQDLERWYYTYAEDGGPEMLDSMKERSTDDDGSPEIVMNAWLKAAGVDRFGLVRWALSLWQEKEWEGHEHWEDEKHSTRLPEVVLYLVVIHGDVDTLQWCEDKCELVFYDCQGYGSGPMSFTPREGSWGNVPIDVAAAGLVDTWSCTVSMDVGDTRTASCRPLQVRGW